MAILLVKVTSSTRAVVLTLISALVCPPLLFVEVVAFMLAGMITYEPGNPLLVKVASVALVVLIGSVCLALPVAAMSIGQRARHRSSSGDASSKGARVALTSAVISAVIAAGVVFVQVFLGLWSVGVCSLDGC